MNHICVLCFRWNYLWNRNRKIKDHGLYVGSEDTKCNKNKSFFSSPTMLYNVIYTIHLKTISTKVPTVSTHTDQSRRKQIILLVCFWVGKGNRALEEAENEENICRQLLHEWASFPNCPKSWPYLFKRTNHACSWINRQVYLWGPFIPCGALTCLVLHINMFCIRSTHSLWMDYQQHLNR